MSFSVSKGTDEQDLDDGPLVVGGVGATAGSSFFTAIIAYKELLATLQLEDIAVEAFSSFRAGEWRSK